MYKKILVPLDGSDYSESVIEHVKAIALGCNVPETVLIAVIEPFRIQASRAPAGWLIKMQKEAGNAAQTYLQSVAEKLQVDGVNAQTEVLEGTAAETIIDYAGKNKIDLIVMSTHGRSGISRWMYGSVADRVVRNSTIPVLAARPPAMSGKF